MLKNYLSFAIRVFSRDKYYTLLNLSGLALGLCCGIIILLYLRHELSFEQHHLKHEQIYRIGSHFTTPEIDARMAISSSMLVPLLKDEYPGIEAFVRFRGNGKSLVTYSQDGQRQNAYEEDFWFADSAMFDVFTHTFIAGNPKSCLKEINSLVLTESVAIRYFGEDAVRSGAVLGNQIRIDNSFDCKLTAIIEDVPSSQHLHFTGLISYHTLFKGEALAMERIKELLWNTPDYSYVLFAPSFTPEQLLDQFPPFFDKYMAEFGANFGAKFVPVPEALADIHFQSELTDDLRRGNATYLYAFGMVGVLLLILACINYMNLATARSARRAKEVGLRKVMGAGKWLLIGRFSGESVLLSLLALLFALLITAVILEFSPVDKWMGQNLSLGLLQDPILLLYAVGLALLIGLISGIYPAFYLSTVQPVKVLKGTFIKSAEGNLLRKILVGAQFVISMGVVITALLMREQIEYVRLSDLGFDKENMLIIPVQDSKVTDQLPAIKNELEHVSGVKGVSFAQQIPGKMDNSQVYNVENAEGVIENQLFAFNRVGYDYLDVMGLELKEGRNFDRSITTDINRAYIVNESLVKKMNWKNPIGKKLSNDFADDGSPQNLGQVIGVIKDFHTTSLHNPVEPLLFMLQDKPRNNLQVKVMAQHIGTVISHIEDRWQQTGSVFPFEYSFLDQDFDKMYKADQRQSNLLSVLSWVCIFISCLGLLGLTSFSTAQRAKEIGVRKVLGASTSQIVRLLFRDIFILILIAIWIAAPLAWGGIHYWLEGFAYRIDIPLYVFVLTALGAILIAFASVGFHIIRVANANPARALAYE